MSNQKVWFITGASKGIGLLVTKLLISQGHKVTATSRRIEDLQKSIGPKNDNFLPLQLDITKSNEVKKAIAETVRHFGGLDVVVNNAGFAFVGSLEELTDEEFRKALDVNLFGTVNVIRAALPHLRNQRSGHIINIASAGGYVAVANLGSYAASKFAIVGLTESLAGEVKSFNVNATVVLPGSFRTNFLDEGSLTYTGNPVGEYKSDATLQGMSARAGTQPGDPDKLVRELVNLTNNNNPPVHLLLGPDSYKLIMDKRAKDLEEFEGYREITMSTNL